MITKTFAIRHAVSRLCCLIPYALRLTAGIALCATLAACGFHLRGQANLPFESIYIVGSPTFTTPLARAVRAGSATRITTNPKEADVTLQILNEARERSILSLSGAGRVQELQLRYRVNFRLTSKAGLELIPADEILLKRDLLYSDSDVLGKELEEALLYRDMQTDAVQQVVRRLQVAHLNPATPDPR